MNEDYTRESKERLARMNRRQQISVRLPQDVLNQAQAIAQETGRTLTSLIELGLRREIGMDGGEVDISDMKKRLERLEELAESEGAL